MAFKNSAGIKFNKDTELIIRADQDGTVESCFNLSNNTEYVNPPATPWDWQGENPEIAKEFAAQKIYLKDTDFATWTPSTTAGTIRAQETLEAALMVEPDNFDYIGVIYFKSHGVYSADRANQFKDYLSCHVNYVSNYPLTPVDYTDNTNTGHATFNISNASNLIYTDNNIAYKNITPGSYGVYNNMTSSFLTLTGSNLKITMDKIEAKCSNSYFSTTEAGSIDKDNSYIEFKVVIYKVKKNTADLIVLINALKEIYNNGISD